MMLIGEWLVRRSMRESRDDGTIGRGQICWNTSSTHSERKPDAKSLRFSFFYVLANEKRAVSKSEKYFLVLYSPFYFGIEFMLRKKPPKAVRRGKTVQITVIKPAKTTLAGKNVRGQHEIPRQIHFGGESHSQS
ncbi:hypothetical protein [uncultured Trichococcus sp.]|uniref:hypothetical protein n=1 Tax=uncultured Trichococcus sp. TaxID=189665 RepID=UPI002A18B480|nr:hypothetical protein [uncultured Trichococcus sp.]